MYNYIITCSSIRISNNTFNDIEVVEYSPNIEKIVNTYSDKESFNPHSVNPNYLKDTEAEENLKKENDKKN